MKNCFTVRGNVSRIFQKVSNRSSERSLYRSSCQPVVFTSIYLLARYVITGRRADKKGAADGKMRMPVVYIRHTRTSTMSFLLFLRKWGATNGGGVWSDQWRLSPLRAYPREANSNDNDTLYRVLALLMFLTYLSSPLFFSLHKKRLFAWATLKKFKVISCRSVVWESDKILNFNYKIACLFSYSILLFHLIRRYSDYF